MKKKFLFLIFSFLLTTNLAFAKVELIFGISATTGSIQYMTAEDFTKTANKMCGNKCVVKFFGNSQIGDDKELMNKLKLGSVHLALPSSMMSSIAGEAGLFDMPFIVKDRNHVRAIEKEIFWPDIHPKIQEKGYTVIGFWENGVRHITNSKRPINTPADLKGLKIRTPKSTWRLKMFEAWGASPSPMEFSEVFTALQTGVMDGQENPYTNVEGGKFQEVQKFLSRTGHVYTPAFLTVGKDQFAKLPADVQKILKNAAEDVRPRMYKAAEDDDLNLEKKLVAAGMKLNVADKASFVNASKPIYAMFAKEIPNGQKLVDKALALAK
jgi:tripartite ATP-independent transporter DctP family solute receptor